MVYRYSWIAGLASAGFAFWQLGSLLLPSASGVSWQLMVLSGFVIGLVVTWTSVAYRLRALWIILINGTALFLAAARFSAPADSFLVLPTPASLSTLWADLGRALGPGGRSRRRGILAGWRRAIANLHHFAHAGPPLVAIETLRPATGEEARTP